MLKLLGVWGLTVFFVSAPLWSEPIKHHPANPHYYLFNGQPTILITSAEHYGGVINKGFDYVKYFDALKAYGMNYRAFMRARCSNRWGSSSRVIPWGPSREASSCRGREASSSVTCSGAISLTSTGGIRSTSRA